MSDVDDMLNIEVDFYLIGVTDNDVGGREETEKFIETKSARLQVLTAEERTLLGREGIVASHKLFTDAD